MKQFKPREKPEQKIQDRIIAFLKERGWVVMVTHGNTFQKGFPDLYALHPRYGQKWIEVKNPKKWKFTPAQKQYFPHFDEAGVGIWVMMEASEDEYKKLFGEPNWRKV